MATQESWNQTNRWQTDLSEQIAQLMLSEAQLAKTGDTCSDSAMIAGSSWPPDDWKVAAKNEITPLVREALRANKNKAPTSLADDWRYMVAVVTTAEWLRANGIEARTEKPLDEKIRDKNRTEFLRLVNESLATLDPPMKMEYNWKDPKGKYYQQLVLIPVKGDPPKSPPRMTLKLEDDDEATNKWVNVTQWRNYRWAAEEFGTQIGTGQLGTPGSVIPKKTMDNLKAHFKSKVLDEYC